MNGAARRDDENRIGHPHAHEGEGSKSADVLARERVIQRHQAIVARVHENRDCALLGEQAQLEEAFAEGILVGRSGQMPEFQLSPRDIEGLTAHLERLCRQRRG
jgi:hypothetical protein